MDRPTLMAWTTARLMVGMGTTTRSSRWGGRDDLVGAHRQLAGRRSVLAVDEQEDRHIDRDEDDHEVGAGRELDRGHHDEHDRGEHGPEAVDARPPPPAGLADAPPVADHAHLAEREAHEHADRIERDEQGRHAAEDDQEQAGDAGQHDDPPVVGEPVAPEPELARHVAVVGQDRREAREGVEARVRREEQDQRGRDLEHVEQRPVAERRRGDERDDRRRPVRATG